MATINDIEKLAFDLPAPQRALLAARLLDSLPDFLDDADEGISEALRRDAEFETNPGIGISLDQFDQQINQNRA